MMAVVVVKMPGPYFDASAEVFADAAKAHQYAYKVKSRHPERDVRVIQGPGVEVSA